MYKKNRFSILLEQLMTSADVKNYTLAKELQYDVSYISKWISGRMLPSEKNLEKVLRTISHCLVSEMDEKATENMYQDYQVDTIEDLEAAIYDNLMVEYNYVKELKNNSGVEVAPKTSYYPEMTLLQFISKMRHPILRKVKSLEIVAVVDLLSIEHEYRMMIADVEGEQTVMRKDRKYHGIHFSMLIDLESGEHDCVSDGIFLMNVLMNANVELQLYGSTQAHGKTIFLVKDLYAISGMLLDRNSCISVTASEEQKYCNVLYHKIKALCRRELLLFRKIEMRDMLEKYDDMQSVLATNLRWLIGHMTEHFLPYDLFEELLSDTNLSECLNVSEQKLRKIHSVTASMMQESKVRIMIYESALNEFVVSGKIDFFNCRIKLSSSQRLRYLKNIIHVMEKNEKVEIQLISGRLVSDFQYKTRPCLFLADTISYMRLGDESYENNVMELNSSPIKKLYNEFYEKAWDSQDEIVISDQSTIRESLSHMLQFGELLDRMEEQ
jgi:transcriptional regulator with XRE-family HTH domain